MKTIYLDNAATTPLDPLVIEAMAEFFPHFGNPASAHPYGWYAAEKVLIAREQVAAAINAKPENIIFTSGATESNNLALRGVAALYPKCGIISATTEHRAVLDPLVALESAGHQVTLLPVDAEGSIDLQTLEQSLSSEVKLLSLMYANNEIGTIHPIAEIAALCKEREIIFHCDATQALGKLALDVTALGVDLLSISAHKCHGPKGVGALYIRPGVSLQAQILGGGHEQNIRSGTLNTLGIVGFGAACERIRANLEAYEQHLQRLQNLLWQEVQSAVVPVVKNGSDHSLPGLLNLSFLGVHNERLHSSLQSKVAFSLASACQTGSKAGSHVLTALNLPSERQQSAVRFSLSRLNTEEEVREAAQAVRAAIAKICKTNQALS